MCELLRGVFRACVRMLDSWTGEEWDEKIRVQRARVKGKQRRLLRGETGLWWKGERHPVRG